MKNNKLTIIQQLKKAGIRVKVEHHRWAEQKAAYIPEINLYHITQNNHKDYHILSNGGLTKVSLTFPNGKTFEAEAYCNKVDTYSKWTGILLCLSRINEQRKIEKIKFLGGNIKS